MKHHYKTIAVGLILLVSLVVLRVWDPYPIEVLRLKGLDYYQRKQEKVRSDNIVVVEIDESALEKNGQWPWNREVLAEGIKKAFEGEAAVVVLPIIYAEPDRLGGDQIFIDTLQKVPVITSQSASTKGKGVPVPRGVATIGNGIEDWLYDYPAAIGPIKEIGEASAGVGMLLTAPELDGVVRRLPLLIQINKEQYPTLPLEVLRVAGNEPSYQVKMSEAGVQAVRVKGTPAIKTDANARVWLNFKYKFDSIPYTKEQWDVKDKIVVIALTAEGLANTVATPVGVNYGYELNLQALQMLIDGNRLERPAEFDLYEMAIGLGIGIILIASIAFFSYIPNIIIYLVAIISPVLIGFNMFNTKEYLGDYTWIVLAASITWMGALFMRFVQEFKLKNQIKKQFGSYVNPTIVERLQKNPSLIKLGGERKELSIVMTDLRGFTTLGESFGDDVEGLTQIMNDYMTALSIPVLKNDGTLIKFIGDASLHVHGAPLNDPDHAVTAVLTAQQMIKAIEGFNKELTAKGRPPVGMGAGVNTGETLIGNIGAKSKFGYDVLGDSVSTAARLEGQTKSYGVLCIIGPKTNELVKDRIFTLELDNIAVKGKTIGLRIYTPLFVSDPGAAAEYIAAREVHDTMLVAYRAQKFDQAIKMSQELMGEFDEQMDHSYELWIERCEYMKSIKLPNDWDGIYRATSK
jgi:adenylate cyclase